MAKFEIDDGGLPVLLTFFENTSDAEVFHGMEKKMRDVFDRVEKIVVINDIAELGMPDANVRKLAAEVDANLREAASRVVLVNIIIIRSKLMRGFMTALRWVNPPSSPQALVGSRTEAADLALETLRKAGLVTTAVEEKLRQFSRAA